MLALTSAGERIINSGKGTGATLVILIAGGALFGGAASFTVNDPEKQE